MGGKHPTKDGTFTRQEIGNERRDSINLLPQGKVSDDEYDDSDEDEFFSPIAAFQTP